MSDDDYLTDLIAAASQPPTLCVRSVVPWPADGIFRNSLGDPLDPQPTLRIIQFNFVECPADALPTPDAIVDGRDELEG